MDGKLVFRSDEKLFYGVPDAEGKITHTRMQGFTAASVNMNTTEYERTYVDEAHSTTDVTGISKSIAYSFDRYIGNPVHDDIIDIHHSEKRGTDTRRVITMVDFSTPVEGGGFKARQNTFSVVCDTSGDGSGTDAMVYSGTFKTAGSTVEGVATIVTPENGNSENVVTIEFTESTGE
jgi:hypothetical protein